jgi:peptide/nickel transport system permease protein
VALAYIVLLVIVGITAPVFVHTDVNQITGNVLAPPGPGGAAGTDQLGRDLFTELLFGVRISLTIGFLAGGVSMIVGIAVGAVAGYFGRALDTVLMRITELFQVMPTFVLAVVIVALLGTGLLRVILVIAALSWPATARVMRGEVLRVKQLEFVDAMRCLGYREVGILFREVIPNAIPAVIPLAALSVAGAILQESSLSFLGLSSPDTVSWGRLLHDSQNYLFEAWWMTAFPGAAIFATVLAFNVFGDAVGTILDPRRARS